MFLNKTGWLMIQGFKAFAFLRELNKISSFLTYFHWRLNMILKSLKVLYIVFKVHKELMIDPNETRTNLDFEVCQSSRKGGKPRINRIWNLKDCNFYIIPLPFAISLWPLIRIISSRPIKWELTSYFLYQKYYLLLSFIHSFPDRLYL